MPSVNSSSRSVRIRPTACIIRDEHILLIEDHDDGVGRHFNLPGGGLEPGESLVEGVKREVMEETSADVEVGKLLLLWESKNAVVIFDKPGKHTLMPIFLCHLKNGSEPRMPEQVTADSFQVGIRWVPLSEFPQVKLLPPIADELIASLKAGSAAPAYIMDARS